MEFDIQTANVKFGWLLLFYCVTHQIDDDSNVDGMIHGLLFDFFGFSGNFTSRASLPTVILVAHPRLQEAMC